ncbi:MAG: CHAT domain-containing protein [Chloroflexia bacterium]|nr:CHAT domain-containing protein [Chloroflexia bacterium]
MNELNFVYRIRIDNDTVWAQKVDPELRPVGGEPHGELGLKGGLLERVHELHQQARRGELKGEHVVGELGEKLFQALLGAPDKALCRDFLDFYDSVVRREKASLRIELDVDEANQPEIAALPWEFMRPERQSGHSFWLATAPQVVFTRRRRKWEAPVPIRLEDGEALRIALAVAAPQGTYLDEAGRERTLGPVASEPVLETLNKIAAPQRIEVETVDPASRVAIDSVLERKQPHILHFIGHARFLEAEQQGQVALVDDLSNAPDWISAQYLSDLFTRWQPGIVLFQSCESAMASASRAFVGVAAQIAQQNIPVVVAMQYRVSNATASRFSQEFYRRLAEGAPVDRAVQEGRRRIALSPTGYSSPDFATPVLFTRLPAGHLFTLPGAEAQIAAEAAVPRAAQGEPVDPDKIAAIRERIVHDPIAGAAALHDYLGTLPGWSEVQDKVALLRNELIQLQEDMDLYGSNPQEQAQKSRAVHTLFKTCSELEGQNV